MEKAGIKPQCTQTLCRKPEIYQPQFDLWLTGWKMLRSEAMASSGLARDFIREAGMGDQQGLFILAAMDGKANTVLMEMRNRGGN